MEWGEREDPVGFSKWGAQQEMRWREGGVPKVFIPQKPFPSAY